MDWKTLSSKEVYRNKWMQVTEDEIASPSGKRFTYGVIHKKPFALIVPWDGARFTLVGQYRHPVGAFSWEFPQGHFEHANIEETAKHELREETGLTAQSIEPLGAYWIGPGHSDQECRAFLATGLAKGETDREASEEGMRTREVTPDELMGMIRSGEMRNGPSLSAIALLRLKGLL